MIGNFISSQSGLKTSQIAIENTSNNIANENSAGYIKRTANFNEANNSNNTYANGVEITSIERQTNEYLAIKIQSESSSQSYLDKNSSLFASLENIFLETDTSGLSKDLNNYFFSMESLRANPNNDIYKTQFENSAVNLVENMQSMYTDIENLQESLKDEMYAQTNEVNKITKEIASLNEEIKKNPNSLELLDKRDYLEQELSKYVDIDVSDEGGIYQLKIAGQTAVFNNTSHDLNVKEEYTSQKDIYDSSNLDDSNIVNGQVVSVTLNNGQSLSIVANTTGASNNDVKQQIVDAINNDTSMNKTLEASLDDKGNLIVESKTSGEESSFDLEIKLDNSVVDKSNSLSVNGSDNIHLEILGKDISLNGGSLKTLDENTSTSNPNNVLYQTQKNLNDFAKTLIELNNSYMDENGSEKELNLFAGSSVMSMNFNSASINNLNQEDLDYISSLQFKDDISFGSNSQGQSFSEYFSSIKVNVSSTKESNDLKLQTQESIVMSLQSSYDLLTKVDSDEELINLMQYQAAYEANAKVITAVDEMIQTVLNM